MSAKLLAFYNELSEDELHSVLQILIDIKGGEWVEQAINELAGVNTPQPTPKS